MYRRHIVTFFGVLLALGLLMAPLATASSTNGDVDSPHSVDQASNIVVDNNQNDHTVVEAAPPSPGKLKFEQVDVDSVNPLDDAIYIVRLQDPPLATYRGGIRGLAGTSPAATGKRKVDARSAASVAYMNYLDQRRAQAISEVNQELARSIEVVYEYKASLNGFAAKMTAAEAAQVAKLPSVQYIEPDMEFELHTDAGPAWLGAPAVWGENLEGLPFKADLSGQNEVPPVTDTMASGTATFSYDVTSGELDFHIEVSDIMSITKAHIHSGTVGVNGPVLYWLYDETGTNAQGGEFGPGDPISGTVMVSDAHKAQLWDGDLYVNIHTTSYPSGELRGQIKMTGTMGEGVIVGVIDTGIDPWNPSFADVGDDGYDHTNPRGEGNYVGVCDPNNSGENGAVAYDATFPCNDKLIGVWGYTASDDNPRDRDGHGSHTASTAAGNVVISPTVESPSETFTAPLISGVAPHANIIMYDGCSDDDPGCPGSALAAARDQVVLDGVDVVNYSIGSSAATPDPWNSSFALQWLNVRDAGIFVATSAGNSGPGDATVGSPGDLPWMTTVGASSHNRAFLNSVIVDDGALELHGLGMTGPLTTAAEIVLAANYVISPTTEDNARLCAPDAFPEGTFNGQIVVCERGQYGRVAKGESVAAGGAGGYILAQPDEFGGGAGALVSDPHVIPGVHIDYNTYQELLAYLDAAGDTPVMGTISGATLDIDDSHADVMASFSSRGPNGGMLPDLIVPNVTAPGRSIWAAYHQGDGGDGDYTFNVIGGTSMSSPHVAGAGALMVAEHPNWTPAQIESALMTTARDSVKNDDGQNMATPFAQGSGHVDLRKAAHAGLVLDVTKAEFEAANPEEGGDAKTLNIASMGNSQCLLVCSWNRTVKNTLEMTQTWNAMVMVADGVTMTGMVDPMSFTLSPGAMQELTITVDASQLPLNEWAFAKVVLMPASRDGHVPAAHLPIAVNPTVSILPPSLEIDTRRNAGSVPIEALRAIEITNLTTSAAMVAANVTNFELNQDPTNDIPSGFYDDLSQVFWMTMTVPADTSSLIAEVLASESPDLDMAVGMDSDGDGQPEESEQVCQSAGGSWNEFCQVSSPDAGVWWVVVLNWEESAHAPDAVTLATAIVPNSGSGNIWVDGPNAVTAGDEFDLRVYWNAPEMSAGERWYGAITLGSNGDNPGNLGTIPVYLNRHPDDVTKHGPDAVAPGETMTYTIEVQANVTAEDLTYSITDTLPAGTTYVEGSAIATAGTVDVTNNTLTWNGVMAVPEGFYAMTTSANDPMCDTGFGGYVNLENFGILAIPDISGDVIAITAFSSGNPFNFYGIDKTGINFTDDGFAFFDTTFEGFDGTNTPLPDASVPNDLLAMYWRDLEIVYDQATNRGVSLASAGDNVILIEYDDLEPAPAGSTSDRFDFQVIMTRAVNDAPGAYEIVYAYDNLVGDISTGSIGLENQDGTVGLQYAHNDLTSSTLYNGLMICFDWVLPLEPVKITYQAMVGAEVSSGITNTLTHNTDNMGSMEATASASTEIDLDADGIGGETEGNAPNNGDGNNDGTPDNEQANVASLPNTGGNYVTLAAPDGVNLTDVDAIDNPAADTAPENVEFPQGFFDFGISGITAGDAVSITLILHEGEAAESYWKYGPITDTAISQWYEFNYDGTTGAQINGNSITLHFVDGQRGDADLAANGVIEDPGAPSIVSETEPTNISLATLEGQADMMWQQLLLALLLLLIVAGGASLHVWRKAQMRA